MAGDPPIKLPVAADHLTVPLIGGGTTSPVFWAFAWNLGQGEPNCIPLGTTVSVAVATPTAVIVALEVAATATVVIVKLPVVKPAEMATDGGVLA
jgi:hypothetical protein